MKADELWEKYSAMTRTSEDAVYHADFLAALAEYGQAVRDRDAEICRNASDKWLDGEVRDVIFAVNIAISREPLP